VDEAPEKFQPSVQQWLEKEIQRYYLHNNFTNPTCQKKLAFESSTNNVEQGRCFTVI
jgi:hypothetical protein